MLLYFHILYLLRTYRYIFTDSITGVSCSQDFYVKTVCEQFCIKSTPLGWTQTEPKTMEDRQNY